MIVASEFLYGKPFLYIFRNNGWGVARVSKYIQKGRLAKSQFMYKRQSVASTKLKMEENKNYKILGILIL